MAMKPGRFHALLRCAGRALPGWLHRTVAAESRLLLPAVSRTNSPYLHVLRGGFVTLSFPAEMETEYRRARDPVLRQRLAVGALMGITLVGLWVVLDLYTGRYFQFPMARFALLAWMLPLLVLLVILALIPMRERPLSPWLVFVIYVLVGLALLRLEIVMETHRLPGSRYPYVALLVVMFSFFITGLMTWRAAFAGLIVTVVYGVSSVFEIHNQAFPLDEALFFLITTVAVGTAGSWRLEHADREQFLMSRLLLEMAEHDGLTGLLNHTAFVSHCTRVWRQAERDGKPIGILMLDIDHFKPYNDHYGHAAGDQCLVHVAEVLEAAAGRGLDAAGRLGGEEFSGFWYDMSETQLGEIAEQVRRNVEALEIPHTSSPVSRHVTVSIGTISVTPRTGVQFEPALKAADEALYAAKAGGRNRIVAAALTPPAASPHRGAGTAAALRD